jgi:hypothetical protein
MLLPLPPRSTNSSFLDSPPPALPTSRLIRPSPPCDEMNGMWAQCATALRDKRAATGATPRSAAGSLPHVVVLFAAPPEASAAAQERGLALRRAALRRSTALRPAIAP